MSNYTRILAFRTSKNIAVIIAFLAVVCLFSSSLIVYSDHVAQAKPNEKDIEKIIKKIKDKLRDDVEKEEEEEEKEEEEKEEEEKVNTDYDYKFVDEDNNRLQNFSFTAAGDFSCSQNAKKTISNMLDTRPELVLPLGDLAVEDNTANCWLDLISPFENKIQITFGYHDLNEGMAKINQYKEVFGLKKLYYSFDYSSVHFLVMSTLSESSITSDQYKFIERDLKAASENENIDWIVVTSYAPFYTSPSTHPAKKDVRNIYHPLFDRYGVDLVLNGHNHNYQRTYPVTFNPNKGSDPTVTNGFTTGYLGNKDGVIYATVGTAGEAPVHPLLGRLPYVATQFEGKFGFLNIEISSGDTYTKMSGTFYDNSNGNVMDYFTIAKDIKIQSPRSVLVQYQH